MFGLLLSAVSTAENKFCFRGGDSFPECPDPESVIVKDIADLRSKIDPQFENVYLDIVNDETTPFETDDAFSKEHKIYVKGIGNSFVNFTLSNDLKCDAPYISVKEIKVYINVESKGDYHLNSIEFTHVTVDNPQSVSIVVSDKLVSDPVSIQYYSMVSCADTVIVVDDETSVNDRPYTIFCQTHFNTTGKKQNTTMKLTSAARTRHVEYDFGGGNIVTVTPLIIGTHLSVCNYLNGGTLRIATVQNYMKVLFLNIEVEKGEVILDPSIVHVESVYVEAFIMHGGSLTCLAPAADIPLTVESASISCASDLALHSIAFAKGAVLTADAPSVRAPMTFAGGASLKGRAAFIAPTAEVSGTVTADGRFTIHELTPKSGSHVPQLEGTAVRFASSLKDFSFSADRIDGATFFVTRKDAKDTRATYEGVVGKALQLARCSDIVSVEVVAGNEGDPWTSGPFNRHRLVYEVSTDGGKLSMKLTENPFDIYQTILAAAEYEDGFDFFFDAANATQIASVVKAQKGVKVTCAIDAEVSLPEYKSALHIAGRGSPAVSVALKEIGMLSVDGVKATVNADKADHIKFGADAQWVGGSFVANSIALPIALIGVVPYGNAILEVESTKADSTEVTFAVAGLAIDGEAVVAEKVTTAAAALDITISPGFRAQNLTIECSAETVAITVTGATTESMPAIAIVGAGSFTVTADGHAPLSFPEAAKVELLGGSSLPAQAFSSGKVEILGKDEGAHTVGAVELTAESAHLRSYDSVTFESVSVTAEHARAFIRDVKASGLSVSKGAEYVQIEGDFYPSNIDVTIRHGDENPHVAVIPAGTDAIRRNAATTVQVKIDVDERSVAREMRIPILQDEENKLFLAEAVLVVAPTSFSIDGTELEASIEHVDGVVYVQTKITSEPSSSSEISSSSSETSSSSSETSSSSSETSTGISTSEETSEEPSTETPVDPAHRQRVIIISCSVGGGLALIVIMVGVVLCLKKRRSADVLNSLDDRALVTKDDGIV